MIHVMNPRWWNSFNILAILLIGVGIYGLIANGHMIYDPGRPSTGWEWLLYLVAGALMLINGLLSSPVEKEEQANRDKKDERN